MKDFKKVKLVCVGLIFIVVAYSLITYMSEGASTAFTVSLALAGIPLGGILGIWGIEAFGEGKRMLGIFEYISAVVCVVISIMIIIIKL